MEIYIEFTPALLEQLKKNGYHSMVHLSDKTDDKKLTGNWDSHYILKPSRINVIQDFEIDGKRYSPLDSDDIIDLSKNDTPLIGFFIEIEEGEFESLHK